MLEELPSHIDKLRVVDESKREEAEEFLADLQENDEYQGIEKEPNEEEKQIIEDVLFGLRIMFRHVYKIEKLKDIDISRVHIAKTDTLKDRGRGTCFVTSGDVWVENLESFTGSKICFASILAHELIHLFSYNEFKVNSSGLDFYRNGLSLSTKDKNEKENIKYFQQIDEAVTAYFTMRFRQMEMLKGQHGQYQSEAQALFRVKSWLKSLPVDIPKDKDLWIGGIEPYVVSIPYVEEMAEVLDSNKTEEEKIAFFQERIGGLPEEIRENFYLERWQELESLNRDFSEAYKDLEVKDKANEWEAFMNKLLLLKITGQGYKEVYRLVEERLGRGSFNRLAHKYAKEKTKEQREESQGGQ